MTEIRLVELWVYPVKSLRGGRVAEVSVDDRGLAHDRRFMVVDGDGRFLSQREHAEMARLSAQIEGDVLRLEARGAPTLELALDEGGERVRATVWDDRVDAIDRGAAAAEWLSEQLGREARLVAMPESTVRAADPRHARAGDRVGFADGFPFLLVNRGSLVALNERLEHGIDVRRFRPNLVVEGAEPFAEDEWGRFEVGDVTFHRIIGCSRCSIVNVDPDAGVRQKEPLAELARFRKRDGAVWFGQNLVHDGPGRLREGDVVRLEA